MTDPNQAARRYCVIGAGPSGLAIAKEFQHLNVPFDHFERHSDVGGLWDINNPGSPIYESAHFISSKTLSGFPSFPMPSDYPDYPRRDQVLAYLNQFAEHHDLKGRIRFATEVVRVVPDADSATVELRTADGSETRRYKGVVCASGINWEPLIPHYPGVFGGELRHACTYKNPREFAGKRVLVVGLGNSGADIACDAVHSAAQIAVSIRRGYHFVPKHIFGKPADVFAEEGPHLPLWLEQPLFGWLQRLLVGDTTQLGMPKPDHKILQSHPLMNDQLLHHLRHGDVSLRADVESLHGCQVRFVDGSSMDVDLVLLATGYSRRIAYLDDALLDPGTWAASHFLTCFSRRFPSLFTLGFAELNGALYPHLERLATLIAHVANAQLNQPEHAAKFHTWANQTELDLSGGRHLISSKRHAHYCDDHALLRATLKAFKHMGWSPDTL